MGVFCTKAYFLDVLASRGNYCLLNVCCTFRVLLKSLGPLVQTATLLKNMSTEKFYVR